MRTSLARCAEVSEGACAGPLQRALQCEHADVGLCRPITWGLLKSDRFTPARHPKKKKKKKGGGGGGSPAAARPGADLDVVHADAGHRGTQPAADLGQDVRVSRKWVVASTIAFARVCGVVGLEDARADEHRLGPELHHERGVGGCGDATGAGQRHSQPARLGDLLHERQRGLEPLGPVEQLGRVGLA